jgi:pimeloyl-ACP methyl ester carboxylesterase
VVRARLLLALAGAGCTSVHAPPPAPERVVPAADGVPIAFEERGRGEPLLVFVHGWCGDRALWRATLAAMADRHRVLALVGHSMGAPVALLAAARLAPLVCGVIAVDALHDADFAHPPGALAAAADELAADFPRALAASFAPLVPRRPELRDWLVARALRTDRRAAAELVRSLESFALAPALSGAGVPVRAINAGGAARPATAVARNRALCDFGARLMEGVGHFPWLEEPAAFEQLLRRTVAELAPPGTTP